MWSIGIYAGASPFELGPPPGTINPVITRESVTDVPAAFVADPFMVQAGGTWYMFCEVLNQRTNKGEIALATSLNGFDWFYQQIILSEPFHLSYPYVFDWGGAYYMVPEALESGGVCIYRADPFPTRWTLVHRLLCTPCADPSIFWFAGSWWLFACTTPYQHDELSLYHAATLSGPWLEHPASPIVRDDKRSARPAGRVLVFDNQIIRFTQDCLPRYGTQIRAFTVGELSTSSYREDEHPMSPVLKASGHGWNALGMHHVDAHELSPGRWIACVDGFAADEQ